jgi:integration host factor subunit beta
VVKTEFIEVLARKHQQLDAPNMERVVNCIIEQMAEALEQGGRIEVRGFGAFSLHRHPAKMGRNPKTGETVKVAARASIHFKPGLELREKVKLSTKTEDN